MMIKFLHCIELSYILSFKI